MTFDEFVTSITQDEIVPSVIDTVLESNVLTLRLLGNPAPWNGENLKIPIKYQSSGSGGSFDGYDVFDTSKTNTRNFLTFRPKAYYQSVVLSNMEQAVNQGKAKVLDLVMTEMDSAKDDMCDGMGDLMYADGTGNGGKDFTGLAAAVDDGTSVATYGGLNRAVYTTIQSTVTNVGGNITLAAMATMYDSCTVGADKPTLIVTTPTIWSYYETLLQPTVVANYEAGGFSQVTKSGVVQNRGALKGEAGFDALWFRGTPMVKDEKCTAQYMYFLNEKYIKFYTLPHPDDPKAPGRGSNIEGAYSEQGNPQVISWTGWKTPVNQDAKIGQFILYGDLVNKNCNRSGVLTGITGV